MHKIVFIFTLWLISASGLVHAVPIGQFCEEALIRASGFSDVTWTKLYPPLAGKAVSYMVDRMNSYGFKYRGQTSPEIFIREAKRYAPLIEANLTELGFNPQPGPVFDPEQPHQNGWQIDRKQLGLKNPYLFRLIPSDLPVVYSPFLLAQLGANAFYYLNPIALIPSSGIISKPRDFSIATMTIHEVTHHLMVKHRAATGSRKFGFIVYPDGELLEDSQNAFRSYAGNIRTEEVLAFLSSTVLALDCLALTGDANFSRDVEPFNIAVRFIEAYLDVIYPKLIPHLDSLSNPTNLKEVDSGFGFFEMNDLISRLAIVNFERDSYEAAPKLFTSNVRRDLSNEYIELGRLRRMLSIPLSKGAREDLRALLSIREDLWEWLKSAGVDLTHARPTKQNCEFFTHGK